MVNDDAYEFLRALDPHAKEFNFRTIREDGSSAWHNDEHHGSLDSVGYELESRNAHCCVSVQINESSNHSFKGEDITRIRAIWVDDDGNKEGAAMPPLSPSFVIETSPGRYHRYWFVEGDWPADEAGRRDFSLVMRGMVENYGCDKQAKDINRVLRLPGTWNRKQSLNEPHLARILFKLDVRYTRQMLVEAFAVQSKIDESQAIVRAAFEDRQTDLDEVQYALSRIPADDREIWIKVGMALKHEFDESGYEIWCEWSSSSPKFDADEQRRAWESFSNDHQNPVTIASVYALAALDAPVEVAERETTPVDIPRSQNDLTERTMAGLKLTFEERNHRPSSQQMNGLQEASLVIQGMADGTLRDRDFYISFLAPGIGKTSTVIEAVRNLTCMPCYDEVGVIILLSRLDEIKRLAEAMGLDSDQYSVICSEGRAEYKLGNQHKQQARVMFTTQQMLEKRCRGSSFEDCDFFFWNGKCREVRIWDEAILPAKSLTVQDNEISYLERNIVRYGSKDIADSIFNFAAELRIKEDKSFIEVPDLKATPYAMETMINWFDENSEEAGHIEALYKMSGLTVRVRKQGRTAILSYEDTLPSDLGPLLVLDASGKTREVYPLWEKHRKGLHFLKSPEKKFNGLTIHLWAKGSGRDERRGNKDEITQAFSDVIRAHLPKDDPILACVHKVKNKKQDPDFEQEIGERCDQRSNLHFITYGNHTATNDYKHCKHVMLVGVLNYSFAANEAIGRGAMAMKTEEEFSNHDYHAVRLGEIGHNIYQAACRGMVRLSEGDHCPEGTTLWVMCPTKPDVGFPRPEFERLFPGASIVDWEPFPKQPKGDVKRLIELEATERGKRMTDTEKAKELGIKKPNLYRLRRRPDYAGARKRITTKEMTYKLPL